MVENGSQRIIAVSCVDELAQKLQLRGTDELQVQQAFQKYISGLGDLTRKLIIEDTPGLLKVHCLRSSPLNINDFTYYMSLGGSLNRDLLPEHKRQTERIKPEDLKVIDYWLASNESLDFSDNPDWPIYSLELENNFKPF